MKFGTNGEVYFNANNSLIAPKITSPVLWSDLNCDTLYDEDTVQCNSIRSGTFSDAAIYLIKFVEGT